MLDKKNYEIKFADFIRLCKEVKATKAKVVLINNPEALGDNYDEMVESLNRLSDAELQLAIVPRAERGKMPA
jgi:hypothetical protein